MTTKKDAKKRKREKRKKKKRKVTSAQAHFIEKVTKSNKLPVSKMIVDPEREAKMSEVILDFAKPFLNKCEDEESEKKAIELAILIWNLSLFPKKSRDQEIEKLCSGLSPSEDANDFAALMNYVNILLERKQEYYPDNKRAIISYQMSGSGKNRLLDVASTLSP